MDDDGDQQVENKLVLFRARPLDAWETGTLLALSRDPHRRVRDWATFTLAARNDDDPVIRQALIDRIDDSDFDTRCEALWGLARRQDDRALQPLLDALEGEEVGALLVEAAGFLARPELVAALESLQPWWDSDPALLADASSRCRGEPARSDRRWDWHPANDNRG
jgi:HEAT repeat protein